MTLFLVDDHTLFRKGLIQLLNKDSTIRIVGEASHGEDALNKLRAQQPDIAVLDIGIPGINGLDIAKFAMDEQWNTSIVVLTMYNDEEYLYRALDLNVKGYLLKENAVSDLMTCLKTVYSGQYYVSPVFSEYLIRRHTKTTALLADFPALESLTSTELHILTHVAENKTSKIIAEELHVSFRTIQTHRANICKKLGLHGHNKLLHFAIKHRTALSTLSTST